jgi:hypothetical protein
VPLLAPTDRSRLRRRRRRRRWIACRLWRRRRLPRRRSRFLGWRAWNADAVVIVQEQRATHRAHSWVPLDKGCEREGVELAHDLRAIIAADGFVVSLAGGYDAGPSGWGAGRFRGRCAGAFGRGWSDG